AATAAPVRRVRRSIFEAWFMVLAPWVVNPGHGCTRKQAAGRQKREMLRQAHRQRSVGQGLASDRHPPTPVRGAGALLPTALKRRRGIGGKDDVAAIGRQVRRVYAVWFLPVVHDVGLPAILRVTNNFGAARDKVGPQFAEVERQRDRLAPAVHR